MAKRSAGPHAEREGYADRSAAFSLPELIIGTSLSSIILAGVMSAFLMLGRSGINATNYSRADAEIRRAIEAFSQDARMATELAWNSAHSVTFTLPTPNPYSGLAAPHTHKVTFVYNPATGVFSRLPGGSASSATPLTLVRHVSRFAFTCYDRSSQLNPAAANFSPAHVKRLQIELNVRVAQATTAATNTPVLASTTLRNRLAN